MELKTTTTAAACQRLAATDTSRGEIAKTTTLQVKYSLTAVVELSRLVMFADGVSVTRAHGRRHINSSSNYSESLDVERSSTL